ncbi:hypothetical protein CW304_02925 [Bacillus sp. UFRGS-B20]|nr:hypothetical protein CW304_02925 [Bacillus sp. UFRGS-B20]
MIQWVFYTRMEVLQPCVIYDCTCIGKFRRFLKPKELKAEPQSYAQADVSFKKKLVKLQDNQILVCMGIWVLLAAQHSVLFLC